MHGCINYSFIHIIFTCRAFKSGFELDPVMCQTVDRQMPNNCPWASCGEWCLTRTSGFCPQIHSVVRRNGTDIQLNNCTRIANTSCAMVSVEKFKLATFFGKVDKIATLMWDCVWVCALTACCFGQVHSFELSQELKVIFEYSSMPLMVISVHSCIYLHLYVLMYSYIAGNVWQLGIYAKWIRWICVSIWRHPERLINISFDLETRVLPIVHWIISSWKKITSALLFYQNT